MGTCDLIRECANYGLLDQISSSSGDTRKQLGNQFTSQLVACLNSRGKSCKQTGADLVDFGTINGCHIVYDVIENMNGTKGSEAKVSCHKNLTGNCGESAGAGITGGESFNYTPAYNPGAAGSATGGLIPAQFEQYLPLAAAALFIWLIARK